MWTANINKVEKDSAGIGVNVTFTSDQGTSETTVFHFQTETPEAVNAAIQAHIDKLTAQDVLLSGVSTGIFTPPVPPIPEPPLPPDPDVLNQKAYEQALSTLAQVNQAVAAGAILTDDPLVASAQANVQAAWSLVSPVIADQVSTAQTSIATQVSNTKASGVVSK